MADAGEPGPSDYPLYEKELERCVEFLQNYRTPMARTKGGATTGPAKYKDMIQMVGRRELVRFEIGLDDVTLSEGGAELARDIRANAKRYAELFATAIDKALPAPSNDNAGARGGGVGDVYDVLMSHRVEQVKTAMLQANPDADVEAMDSREVFPPALYRRFEVRFAPSEADEAVPLREVKAQQLGCLVSVKCIVIRASDVKPLLQVATYTCDECGFEIYQEVTGKTVMPVPKCISPACVANQTPGRVTMQTRGSKFAKYQEVRVQELPEQVPVGHIPRAMTVVARGEVTRVVIPGDIISVTGIFLPTPYTGFQAMRAGLAADTYLEAHHITKLKKDAVDKLGESEARIQEVSDNDPYNTLSRSIAPEIYGMEDVKKALLLQLVGGVTQTQSDGMKTRGDLNICLMGDPGVAKSQLLKHIHKLAPRAVYTTGKGSSGVGLTAAIVKDPFTGELALEGGALVLADMGVCCIDEFDKMEEGDRTAIHEVMEQQTVSIAKAGITTTLNARTAILAAANPKYGRYNRRADPDAHVALMKNINLPAALLSRFDLLFLLLDEVDSDNDKALAAHITFVHQNEEHPPLDFVPVQPAFIRQYISVAKHIVPVVPRELASYVVEAYVDMRQKDKSRASKTGGRGTLTARQLLSILRMSQALARLEMRMEVVQKDVDEAIRLISVSKASVMESETSERPVDSDYVSRIWGILRDKAVATHRPFLTMVESEALVQQAGFNADQLRDTLNEYSELQLLQVNASRTRIDFVSAMV